MLSFPGNARIFVHTGDTDMRKGCQGLSGIIREQFQSDPTDGSLFIFINRRRDRMKLLHFADGGFWLYYRYLASHCLLFILSLPFCRRDRHYCLGAISSSEQ